ncbi:MAG: efflux RND transporter periplasmic adaptor subunit [Planctomycetaceae bacterium]
MSSYDESEEIERAKREIHDFLRRLEQLAHGDTAVGEFFGFLQQEMHRLMESVSEVVWLVGETGQVEPVVHAGIEATGVSGTPDAVDGHNRLVTGLFASPTGLIVPPGGSVAGPDGAVAGSNATDLIVVSAPIDSAAGRAGLIEIFHHPNQDDVQRGYLRFSEQVAGLAAVFLDRRRNAQQLASQRGQLAEADAQQAALSQLERFSRAVHESLDPVATAFVMANEARRIIGCDRVSVLVKRGRRLRLEAVSGQESVERRASAVQAIEALARVVAKAGDPLWHPDAETEVLPQIEEALEAYIDESHATALAILPLAKPRPTPVVKPGGVDAVAVAKAEAAPAENPEPIGVLVAEWFSSAAVDGGRRARVELVAEHGRVALANALEHTGLPLYPLLNALGKSRALTTARNLPTTVTVALATLAALAALVLVPAELRLEGKGTLEPVHRRDVFAQIDGVVERVEAGVEGGAEVKAGQLLATLRNRDLEVAIADVVGRKASSEEQLVATRRSLLEDDKISADEKLRLAGRRAQLEREVESLAAQLALYAEKRKELEVRSPIDGVIVTWQVRDLLLLRPVEKGQVLMSVADKTGPWELEINMPDDRLGHVNQAATEAKAAGRELMVDYILATDPGTRHRGSVREIHEQAEVHGDEGNTVLVRVTIDPSRHEKEELGAGASVTARIACGKRPLGYVWFHDLLAFIQTQILFRLW